MEGTRMSKVNVTYFQCLKCGRCFFNVKVGEDHQASCPGVKKGFRIPSSKKVGPK